jgi:hypothetical protein
MLENDNSSHTILDISRRWKAVNFAIAYQMVSKRSGSVINKYLTTKNPKLLGKVSI